MTTSTSNAQMSLPLTWILLLVRRISCSPTGYSCTYPMKRWQPWWRMSWSGSGLVDTFSLGNRASISLETTSEGTTLPTTGSPVHTPKYAFVFFVEARFHLLALAIFRQDLLCKLISLVVRNINDNVSWSNCRPSRRYMLKKMAPSLSLSWWDLSVLAPTCATRKIKTR